MFRQPSAVWANTHPDRATFLHQAENKEDRAAAVQTPAYGTNFLRFGLEYPQNTLAHEASAPRPKSIRTVSGIASFKLYAHWNTATYWLR